MSVSRRRKSMICRASVGKVPFQLAPTVPMFISPDILLLRISWHHQAGHLYSVIGTFVPKAMVEWWIRKTSLMLPLR